MPARTSLRTRDRFLYAHFARPLVPFACNVHMTIDAKRFVPLFYFILYFIIPFILLIKFYNLY